MKKILLTLTALSIVLTACMKIEEPLIIENIEVQTFSMPNADVTFTAVITSKTYKVASAVLTFNEQEITLTQNGDIYTGVLPGQNNGVIATWTLSVVNSEGRKSQRSGTVTWILDYTKLVLNEISGEHKFVEIYNSGEADINLEGVRLQRNQGSAFGGSEWVGTADDVIPAGAYRLFLFNAFTPSLETNPAYVGWTVSSGISDQQILKVAIVDPTGVEIDLFIRGDVTTSVFGESVSGRERNYSYSRMADGTWANALPTPGAANGAKEKDIVNPGYFTINPVATLHHGRLILNEVSGNNKFVEIFNPTAFPVSLDGVKLQRNGGASEWVGTAADLIPAGAYRLFLFNAYTPEDLAENPAFVGWTVGSGISSGQILKVAIVDPSGTEVSTFIRGDVPLPAWGATAGVTQNLTDTYSRMSDGTWAFAAPTPGAANGPKLSEIINPGYLTAQP